MAGLYHVIAACLLLLAATAHAHVVEGHVLPLPEAPQDWKNGIRIVLDRGQQSTFLDQSGKFRFANVEKGWHTLDIISPHFIYLPVRVEILESGFTRATAANWLSLTAAPNLKYPLQLRPVAQAEYFQKRAGWSPLDLLKNPMLIMMLVMGGIAFVLPKMMEGMDQQALEEIRGKPAENAAWDDLNKTPSSLAVKAGTHRNAGKQGSSTKKKK